MDIDLVEVDNNTLWQIYLINLLKMFDAIFPCLLRIKKAQLVDKVCYLCITPYNMYTFVSRWWRSNQSCRYWKYYTMIHIFVWGIAAISLYTSTAATTLIAVMAFHTPPLEKARIQGELSLPLLWKIRWSNSHIILPTSNCCKTQLKYCCWTEMYLSYVWVPEKLQNPVHLSSCFLQVLVQECVHKPAEGHRHCPK